MLGEIECANLVAFFQVGAQDNEPFKDPFDDN